MSPVGQFSPSGLLYPTANGPPSSAAGAQPPLAGVTCVKAYKNMDFLATPAARNIRVQCELQEPGCRLLEHGVHNVVMFFGSARAKSRPEFDKKLASLAADSPDRDRLLKTEFLVEYYESIRELTRRFTLWNKRRATLLPSLPPVQTSGKIPQQQTDLEEQRTGDGRTSHSPRDTLSDHLSAGMVWGQKKPTYVVATGGGPGMMQAANEGAYLADGPSIGFGISLPFESSLNPYVTPALAFEFHYFFTRKFWMAYKLTGLICGPGGFGTLDELFEILTLVQTGKIKRSFPVVLFGERYWNKVINLQAMADFGMISQQDYDCIYVTDSVDDAFEYLTTALEKSEVEAAGPASPQSGSPKCTGGDLSPPLAPMRDPCTGAPMKDPMGRVRKVSSADVASPSLRAGSVASTSGQGGPTAPPPEFALNVEVQESRTETAKMKTLQEASTKKSDKKKKTSPPEETVI